VARVAQRSPGTRGSQLINSEALGSSAAACALTAIGKRSYVRGMNLDLTDHEAALLLEELNDIIDGDRYFLSDRIETLKAIRAKIRPEPAREPRAPPPKSHVPPRATRGRRRSG
jgi:hypothetical protein